MKVSLTDAIKMLPENKDRIKTMRQITGYEGNIAQSHYSKRFLKSLMKKHGVKIAGETAQAMNFGLVVEDGEGQLFIETMNRI